LKGVSAARAIHERTIFIQLPASDRSRIPAIGNQPMPIDDPLKGSGQIESRPPSELRARFRTIELE
jgi:hypothetical protein